MHTKLKLVLLVILVQVYLSSVDTFSMDTLNYVVNGDFEEDSLNWRLYTGENGSQVSFDLEREVPLSGERSARLIIGGKGTNPFDSQFNAYFTVHKDRTILLSFQIRSSDSSFFNFEVCRNYPPYTALFRSTDTTSGIVIGPETINLQCEITPNESDPNFRLGFLLGNLEAGDTVWLDKVEILQKDTAWDGNIIANPEFDEYRDPDPDFPDYRKKRLFWGTDPNNEGGWEGGFCFGAPTGDMVFDIDTTGKLSGRNSAHITVNQKTGSDFFNGAYTGFFQASQGKAYELSFEAVATGNVPLSVAFNRQPFSNLESEEWNVGPPYYAYAPDRFFLDFTISTEKKTYTVSSSELTLSQGMHQVFFANFPEGSSEFWIDNVRLREIEASGQEPEDSIPPGYSGNPIIRHMFTADPCAMVHNDTLYLFTGHDEQNTVNEWFYMRNWHVFSTTDMINYTDHGAKLSYTDFSWASGNAFAGHCIYRNGKFYWYVPMTHKTIKVDEGFAIGVAVSDRPTGPYTDAIGQALITDNTPNSLPLNIDPAVFIDDDGQAYLFWGSWGEIRMVKLRDNMIETDGEIQNVNVSNFFEAPWLHKRNGIYYLTYASSYPSVIAYSTSNSIYGPWAYRGVLNDYVENCETNHPSIVKYKWNWYFFYHNGALPTGGNWRRSVCVDLLYYNENGTMQPIVQTWQGVPEMPVGFGSPDAAVTNPLHIYPNPLSGNALTIELPAGYAGRELEIGIYDSAGRFIRTERAEAYGWTGNEISLIRIREALAPGPYIVIVRSGDLFHSALLMVTRR